MGSCARIPLLVSWNVLRRFGFNKSYTQFRNIVYVWHYRQMISQRKCSAQQLLFGITHSTYIGVIIVFGSYFKTRLNTYALPVIIRAEYITQTHACGYRQLFL